MMPCKKSTAHPFRSAKKTYDSLRNKVSISHRELETIIKQLKKAPVCTIKEKEVDYKGYILHYYFHRISTSEIDLVCVAERNEEDIAESRYACTSANVSPTRLNYYTYICEAFDIIKKWVDGECEYNGSGQL